MDNLLQFAPVSTVAKERTPTLNATGEAAHAWLLAAAAGELLLSLALAWLGAFTLYLRPAFLTRLFPRPMYLIKTHIDFLLMALLMMAFYFTGVALPGWVVACVIIGSLTNPALFMVLAVNPSPNMSALSPLGISTVVSFLIATAGFGGAAWLILMQALAKIA